MLLLFEYDDYSFERLKHAIFIYEFLVCVCIVYIIQILLITGHIMLILSQ